MSAKIYYQADKVKQCLGYLTPWIGSLLTLEIKRSEMKAVNITDQE